MYIHTLTRTYVHTYSRNEATHTYSRNEACVMHVQSLQNVQRAP